MDVGTLVAAFRVAPNKALQRVGGVYVEFFRNIPLLVLLFITYPGLRRAGVDISAYVAGVASLGELVARLSPKPDVFPATLAEFG